MRFLPRQSGYTLIELVIVMSISALVMIPLTGIVASQILKAPARVRGQLTAAHQSQNVIVNLAGDALAAQEFIPGNTAEQEYGIFKWFELSGQFPVLVSARYFWEDGQVFRQASFGDNSSPPQVAINNVAAYEDVVFDFTPSEWVFNPVSKKWQYNAGRIDVRSAEVEEAGAGFTDTVFVVDTVTAFRSQLTRPVPLAGRIDPKPPAPTATTSAVFMFPLQVPGNRSPGGLTIASTTPEEVWVVNEESDDGDDDDDDDGGGTNHVYRYSQQGVFLGTVALTMANKDAKGITTDGTSFWVIDEKDKKVYRYLMDGTFQDSFLVTTPNTHLHGITYEGTSLWIVDKNAGVFRYSTSGVYLGESFGLNFNNSHAEGITAHGTGLWVVDRDSDQSFRYNKAGTLLASFVVSPARHPEGIGSLGNSFWVVDKKTDKVYRFDPDPDLIPP